jgi:hypothetical protein
MKINIGSLLSGIVLIVAMPLISLSQVNNEIITVKGQLLDLKGATQFNNVMVINRRTQNGVFGNLFGQFSIIIKRTDTISIHALGFSPTKVCYKDSTITNKEIQSKIALYRLNVSLDEIVFVAPRDLNEIQKDIQKLGYQRKYDKTAEFTDAINSPITALYERFSHFEKQKAEAKRLQNESNRKKILKELFKIYVNAEILDLEDWEFDDFVNYCNFDDSFIKASTQYELVMAVKKKFERYKEVRKY